jgi:hypothetical protein
MANKFSYQIQNDGFRNAVIKITGVLDTADAVLTPAVSLNDFTNNEPQGLILCGFAIKHLWLLVGDGLEVQLTWAGLNDQPIFAIAGRGRESFEVIGPLQPNQANPGYNGNINLFTTGYGTGEDAGMPIQNFTVLLEMIKLYKH